MPPVLILHRTVHLYDPQVAIQRRSGALWAENDWKLLRLSENAACMKVSRALDKIRISLSEKELMLPVSG
jgi:hypothetical protein